MTFCIATVCWSCRPWVAQTLNSIVAQHHDDWRAHLVVDASEDDTAEEARHWLARHPDPRITATFRDERHYAVENQRHAIATLDPADDDIVVWLDGDGDRFAHRHVLDRLATEYADPDVMLTYGSYRPVPEPRHGWPPAEPFPLPVIYANAYRTHIKRFGATFNHLRTMRGRIVKAIPDRHFRRVAAPHGPYYGGTDYVFMTAGLELAGGRHRFIPDVLVHYNHANPLADNKARGASARADSKDYINRQKPLKPLDGLAVPCPYLPDHQRRTILARYATDHDLRTFIETGTSAGDTTAHMAPLVDRAYTVELDRAVFERARRRFRRDRHTNIDIRRGDSAHLLPAILGDFDGPALVWLDGHHCGGSSPGRGANPVRHELAALFTDGRPHVILIDDARLFAGGVEHDYTDHAADWPALTWIEQEAADHGYSYELTDDIIRLIPQGVT